jgi:hypothetical protein
MYIIASESISAPYFINPSSQSVRISPTAARQRLGRDIVVATSAHTTIDELLNPAFSMKSASFQGKWGVLPRTCYF